MRSTRNPRKRSGNQRAPKLRSSSISRRDSAHSNSQGIGGKLFHFLGLPPEIRVMVYEALIPPQINLIVVEPDCLDPRDMALLNLPEKRSLPSQILMLEPLTGYKQQRDQLKRILEFFCCYPSLYREVQPLLYSAISVASCLSCSENALWQYNASFCNLLQYLDLWYQFYSTKDENVLQRHPALKTLTLRFMRTSQINEAHEDLSTNRSVVRRVRHILNSAYSTMTQVYVRPFKEHQHFSAVVCVAPGAARQRAGRVSDEGPKIWIDVSTLSDNKE